MRDQQDWSLSKISLRWYIRANPCYRKKPDKRKAMAA